MIRDRHRELALDNIHCGYTESLQSLSSSPHTVLSEAETQSLLRTPPIDHRIDSHIAITVPYKGATHTKAQRKLKSIIQASQWKHLAHIFNPQKQNTILLIILLILLIFAASSNKVLFRLVLYPMSDYSFFMSILASAVSIPLFGLIAIIRKYIHPDPMNILVTVEDHSTGTGAINNNNKPKSIFPHYQLALLGFLDSLTSLAHFTAGSHLSGPITVLLAQSVIPFTMIFSKFALHATYHNRQYLGVGIVLLGILTAELPVLLLGRTLDTDNSESWKWSFLYLMASLPTAIGHVIREHILHDADHTIDVYRMNYYCSIYQLLAAIPLLPILLYSINSNFNEFIINQFDAISCWFNGYTSTGDLSCASAPLLINLYLTANISYHLLLLIVIKIGSAALLTINSALVIPMANIAFTLSFIVGQYARPMNLYDCIALILILFGVLLYGSVNKLKLSAVTNVITSMLFYLAIPMRSMKNTVNSTVNTVKKAANKVKNHHQQQKSPNYGAINPTESPISNNITSNGNNPTDTNTNTDIDSK